MKQESLLKKKLILLSKGAKLFAYSIKLCYYIDIAQRTVCCALLFSKIRSSLEKVNMTKLFDSRNYNDLIEMDFRECPKILTIGRHADLEETTQVYCVDVISGEKLAYFVPEQKLLSRQGPELSIFHLVKVSKQQNIQPTHWLVIYSVSRKGFLVPIEVFDDNGLDHNLSVGIEK